MRQQTFTVRDFEHYRKPTQLLLAEMDKVVPRGLLGVLTDRFNYDTSRRKIDASRTSEPAP